MALYENRLEVCLDCDFKKSEQGYRVKWFVEGKEFFFGSKKKYFMIQYQDKTCRCFQIVAFFIRALNLGKVYDVGGVQTLKATSKLAWQVFVTSKYLRVKDIPTPKDLETKFSTFECSDELTRSYLLENDGEEIQNVCKNYVVCIDLTQKTKRQKDFLTFLQQQQPNTELSHKSDLQTYNQFSRFERELFELLNE